MPTNSQHAAELSQDTGSALSSSWEAFAPDVKMPGGGISAGYRSSCSGEAFYELVATQYLFRGHFPSLNRRSRHFLLFLRHVVFPAGECGVVCGIGGRGFESIRIDSVCICRNIGGGVLYWRRD
jgi:hypothetical protein